MIHPTRPAPPVILQHLVLALLSARDQETISGDLLEAYSERQRRNGRLAANLWYARQAISFIPRAVFAACSATPGLVFLCCFTALCGAWLGTMDIRLHHPHLLRHECISGLIVGQGLLTLLSLPLRHFRWMRWAAMAGGVAVTCLGARALLSTLNSTDIEGYILIIAAMLILQAALTWRTMLRRNAAAA